MYFRQHIKSNRVNLMLDIYIDSKMIIYDADISFVCMYVCFVCLQVYLNFYIKTKRLWSCTSCGAFFESCWISFSSNQF